MGGTDFSIPKILEARITPNKFSSDPVSFSLYQYGLSVSRILDLIRACNLRSNTAHKILFPRTCLNPESTR
jgi:hypothetical protein